MPWLWVPPNATSEPHALNRHLPTARPHKTTVPSESTSTPWPLLLAFGIAVAELGIFLGYAVVAVPGVVLFGGSFAGGLAEAGYVRSRPQALALSGVALSLLGGVTVLATSLTLRGLSILVGGLLVSTVAVLDARRGGR